MKIFGYDLTKIFGWIADAYAVTKALEVLDENRKEREDVKV